MIVISVLVGLAAAVLLLPSISDLLSLGVAWRRPRSRRPAPPSALPHLLFLIPAHDEEPVLDACLASLAALHYPRARMTHVVIADNCSDATAALARQAGVECLERLDPDHPGKPHAIAWALGRLAVRKYDAVVIVDADTVVDADFASALAQESPLANVVVQGYDGVHNRTSNAITRMATVLATANYEFAFPLKQAAHLNVPLRGTGVAIGTALLADDGWPAFTIGEDWELYVLLTLRGASIRGAPGARIYALEAESLRQAYSQRRRWTGGRLTVLFRYISRVLRERRIGLRQRLDLLAALAEPGPAVHLAAAALLGTLALVVTPPGASVLAGALLASLLRPSLYAIAALTRDPEPFRATLAFTVLPLYAVWRLATEFAALGMLGTKPWIRTPRT